MGASVVAFSQQGFDVTLTLSQPHNFVAGDSILVSGFGTPIDTPFDQTNQTAYLLKAVTPTTITYTVGVSQNVHS